MNENQIKGALISSGANQTIIAQQLSLSNTSISRVIKRRDKSRRVTQAIADQIKKPLEVVFPEYKKQS